MGVRMCWKQQTIKTNTNVFKWFHLISVPCNETITFNSFVLNKSDDTVIYMCNPGYYLAAGSYQLNCTADGFWNGTEPTCLRKL